MLKDLVGALAGTAAAAEKKQEEECLIDGMTPYTYMRYQKLLGRNRYGRNNTRIQPVSVGHDYKRS